MSISAKKLIKFLKSRDALEQKRKLAKEERDTQTLLDFCKDAIESHSDKWKWNNHMNRWKFTFTPDETDLSPSIVLDLLPDVIESLKKLDSHSDEFIYDWERDVDDDGDTVINLYIYEQLC